MITTATYDEIGVTYAALRAPDPRIAGAITAALGDARSVVNVGAGTGSYEPAGRRVIAVEPSKTMVAQRAAGSAPAVQAVAAALPFADAVFDAAMAVLTVHHWADIGAGLAELRRVTTGPIVLLTFDPAARPWLTDYLPELATLDDAQFPRITDYAQWLGAVSIAPVPVPHDCRDGFLYAYWRRPTAYLDPHFRSGSSSFWAIGDAGAGLARLADDLHSGDWARRYADLVAAETYDAGYRLVVARP